MKSVFNICNVDFVFDLRDISTVFRMNLNNYNKLVDFDNRVVIRLSKVKNSLRLCSTSSKIKDFDIVFYLKSNYEFMEQILRCIDIISNNFIPKKFDHSEITGSTVLVPPKPLSEKEVIMKWKLDGTEEFDSNKIIITVF